MYNTRTYNFIYEENKIINITRIKYKNENKRIGIIKFIFVLLFVSFIIYYNKIINKDIIEANTFKKESKKTVINYMENCIKGLLMDSNTSSYFNDSPKISVVIPCYNSEKYIKNSIRSVQNQNMKNFEIIVINDNSKDNSLNIIESLQKEDKRIKILNNNKNMGTLYSRSIGALNAKGEFIFPLDNDDMFSSEDIFEKIYDMAKTQNYDIVEFKTFDVKNYINKRKILTDNFFNHHPNNLILHQPELNIFPISKNDEFYANDFHVWGKCIISRLYKKAVHALGKERYSIYNCWTEDIIIILIIFKFANSFIFVNKYGIVHMENNVTTTYNLNLEFKFMSEIYLLEIMMDFLNNTQKLQKYFVSKALLLENMNIIPYLNDTNKLYLKNVLNKMLNSEFFNNDNKIKINNLFNITNLL